MKSSDLNKLFNGVHSIMEFRATIENDVSFYSTLMKKTGSTIPLHFFEDEEVVLNKSALALLLSNCLHGNLTNMHLAYIFDCISLNENVEYQSEQISEVVFDLADPEINGGYKSDEDLKLILKELNESAQ